jgi:hypothetical protein
MTKKQKPANEERELKSSEGNLSYPDYNDREKHSKKGSATKQ